MDSTTPKLNFTLTGILFIAATVSSIIGLKLYDPLLNEPDFLVQAAEHSNQIITGAISELILAATATGTGIMLYPYLKRYNENLGIGYLSFRILEVVFIMIGIVSVLTALSVSDYFANGRMPDKATAQSLGLTCIAMHKWTFILGPNFMLAINTFIYSYVFVRTKLIPVALSVLGLIASCMIMAAAILELFGIIEQLSVWGILLALPIALYEMILAVWLLVKGIRKVTVSNARP